MIGSGMGGGMSDAEGLGVGESSQGMDADAVGSGLGNVDGGSGIGLDHSGRRGFRGRARGRGKNRGNPHAGAWGNPNTVDPGLAQAMADMRAARGRNRGYRAGNPHTDVLNPDVAQATGFVPGHALLDRYGHPVTLDNLSFTRDDLLDDAKYETWAKQNPDKVRNMPGMLGGLLNSLGLHDLSGAMTPEENAFADARWGGSIGDPQAQPRRPSQGGFVNGLQGIAPELIRQYMHQQALSNEGGDNYDGRYERRNPRAYDEEARWDAQGGFGGGT